MCLLENLEVYHVQGKNYKEFKRRKSSKSTSKTKDENLLDFKFF